MFFIIAAHNQLMYTFYISISIHFQDNVLCYLLELGRLLPQGIVLEKNILFCNTGNLYLIN